MKICSPMTLSLILSTLIILSANSLATSTPTPAVPSMFPFHISLYPRSALEPSPFHLTSWIQQTLTFLLCKTPQASPDLPLRVPIFQVPKRHIDDMVLYHTLPVFTGLGWCPIVSWDFTGAVSIFGPDTLPVIHQ